MDFIYSGVGVYTRIRKVRFTIEFANEIYCLTRIENRFLFFFLSTPSYISLSLIKHVNLCFRREFLRAKKECSQGGKKTTNVLHLRTPVSKACAYWISDTHVSGWGGRRRSYGFLYAREKKIINVLCFINLMVRHERPSKISARQRGRLRRVSVETGDVYIILYIYYIVYNI